MASPDTQSPSASRPRPRAGDAGGCVPASPVLGAKLRALRRRWFAVEAVTGIALALLVSTEVLGVAMVLDWWFDLPLAARALMLAGQLALFNALLYPYVFRPRIHPPDDDDLALRVEAAHPRLSSRLISSVQFGRPGSLGAGASSELAAETISETEALTARMDFTAIVSTRRMKRLALAATSVLLVSVAAFLASRSTGADLLRRALLADVPVPRKTRIDVVTGPLLVGRGDTLKIEVLASGILPDKGSLDLQSQGRRDQSLDLPRIPEQPARYARAIESVQEDFSYVVRVNDAVSPPYRVTVVPRPSVNPPECEQIPPAYTGLKPMHRAPGDLSLLAGSRLRFHATATKDVRSASLRLIGLNDRTPLPIDPAHPRDLTGEIAIPAKGLTGFAFDLQDTQGMTSGEGTIYRVDIVPDRPPQTRITWPERKEELITRLATVIVGLDVADDFAVQHVALKYKVNTLEGGAEKALELALDNSGTNRVRRRFEWKIGGFQPPLQEGSVVEFWIEAQDNNNVTGPGIGVSEHQVARVVSENEKRADLLNRAGDSIGALGDITADQEKLNRSLGTLILERTGAR
jgi:hypothetical protein